jgi:hypothetical protein
MLIKIFIFTWILILLLIIYNSYIKLINNNKIINDDNKIINDDNKIINDDNKIINQEQIDDIYIYGPNNASMIYESIAYSPNTWIYSTNENEIDRTSKVYKYYSLYTKSL